MKFKLEELPKIVNNLERLSQIDMLQTVAYRLQRNHDKIESAYKAYMKSRTKLERKYGKYKTKKDNEILTLAFKDENAERGKWQDDKGHEVKDFIENPQLTYWEANNDEDMSKYEDEVKGINNNETEEIDIHTVKISELVKAEGGGQTTPINIKPMLLSGLGNIIIEG
ncbi:MAG TPA: hypothetical protein VHP30_10710 [Ignavibacteriales bacterium]|nr:hypothetical protein [Ignavibacteriales bacterium]